MIVFYQLIITYILRIVHSLLLPRCWCNLFRSLFLHYNFHIDFAVQCIFHRNSCDS